MSSKARVEFDPRAFGLRVAIQRDHGGAREVVQWEPVAVRRHAPDEYHEPSDADWLRLPEDDFRALYEALADHFGHSGNDTRALRRDYDAERGRVDKLIGHLIGRGSVS